MATFEASGTLEFGVVLSRLKMVFVCLQSYSYKKAHPHSQRSRRAVHQHPAERNGTLHKTNTNNNFWP